MGFEWEFNSKISPLDLLNKITEIEGQQLSQIRNSIDNNIQFEASNIENMVCVRKHGNRWFGIFVRFIDRSAIMKLLKSNNELRIGSQDLQQNEKLSEVNFFLFDEPTKRGAYAYYHQSTWIDNFNKYVRNLYDTLNSERIKEIDRQVEGGRISKAEGDRHRKEFSPLKTSIVTSQQGFENLIRQMNLIDKVSFSLKADFINDDGFSPLRTYARSQKIEIGISSHNAHRNRAAVVRDILAQAGKDCIKSMSVYGKSSPDRTISDIVAKIRRNYEYYAKRDYLEIYREINIDFQNLDAILNPEARVFNWLDSVMGRM